MSNPTGVSPHLIVDGAARAIDFYKAAFDAIEIRRVPESDGNRLIHAELTIRGTTVYLCDDFPEYRGGTACDAKALGGSPIVLHQYVSDCDAAVAKAERAGATVTMPAQDQFWGDRYAQVTDPFGLVWSLATPLQK